MPREPSPCVTFDLWETLILDEPERERRRIELRCSLLHEALSRHGISVPLSDLRRGHDESVSWLMEAWKKDAEVPTVEHVRYIIGVGTNHSVKLTEELSRELVEAYSSPVLTARPVLNPETVGTLRGLQNRGYKIGLICNVGRGPSRTLRQLLDEMGILQFFEATVFSDEVGWRKPDPRIFQITVKHLGVSPANITHVGDNPRDDVWGARQVGMHAILYDVKVPEGFANNPRSLFFLTRTLTKEQVVEPDFRIKSLRELFDHLSEIS